MTINQHAAAEIGHVSRCVHLDDESGHQRDVPQAPGAEPDRRVRWCLVPRLDQTLGVRVPDVRAVLELERGLVSEHGQGEHR